MGWVPQGSRITRPGWTMCDPEEAGLFCVIPYIPTTYPEMRYCGESEGEGCFVTLHVVMMTADRKGLVWVTERGGYLGEGHGNFGTVEKIKHVSDLNVAYSVWGDGTALLAMEKLESCLRETSGWFSDPGNLLNEFAAKGLRPARLSIHEKTPADSQKVRGIIFATLGESPRLYRTTLGVGPVTFNIYDEVLVAGDGDNPANVFARYYYQFSGKTVEELIRIGTHTVRLARLMNSMYIGELDIWVCESGIFRQLNTAEVAARAKQSEELDAVILKNFAGASV